jgi:hypothetical protein
MNKTTIHNIQTLFVTQPTVARIMEKLVFDFCLERHSSASDRRRPPDRDSRIPVDVALVYGLVRFALFFPPLCLRQRLPRLGQLTFPSKLLRRFLRGCVVATAHGLVTAPAIVCVGAETEMFWMNRIVARVMSGAVMKEEGRLQAAAAARIEGKSGFRDAVASGDVADVLSYLISHPNCANERDVG